MIKDNKGFCNVSKSETPLIQEILPRRGAYLAYCLMMNWQDMLENCDGLCWPYTM